MSKKAGGTSRCATTQWQTDNALQIAVMISARSFSRTAHDLYGLDAVTSFKWREQKLFEKRDKACATPGSKRKRSSSVGGA
jgi:hypothetical protein